MVSAHGATVHRPTSNGYFFNLKKRTLRLIYFVKPRDHSIPFFIESNYLPRQSFFFQKLGYV